MQQNFNLMARVSCKSVSARGFTPRVHDGELTAHVRHSDNGPMMLRPVTEDTFTLLEDGALRFDVESGIPKRAFLTAEGIRNIVFIRN